MIAPTPPLKTVNAMPAPNNKALTVSIQLLFDPPKKPLISNIQLQRF